MSMPGGFSFASMYYEYRTRVFIYWVLRYRGLGTWRSVFIIGSRNCFRRLLMKLLATAIDLFSTCFSFFKATLLLFVTSLRSLPLQDLVRGECDMPFLQVLAAGKFSSVTPSCGGAVDGYLQWCATVHSCGHRKRY